MQRGPVGWLRTRVPDTSSLYSLSKRAMLSAVVSGGSGAFLPHIGE